MVLRYFITLLCALVFFSACPAQKKEHLPRFQKHYVRDRETASSIAATFNIKLKDFLMLNNFPNDVKLQPGEQVLIRQLKDGETVADEKPYTARKSGEDGKYESYVAPEVKSNAKKEAPAKKEATATSKESDIEMLTGPNGAKYELSSGGFHTVQKGQTFYRIALIYHLTMDELKALNNMTTTDIKVGQELRVSK